MNKFIISSLLDNVEIVENFLIYDKRHKNMVVEKLAIDSKKCTIEFTDGTVEEYSLEEITCNKGKKICKNCILKNECC